MSAHSHSPSHNHPQHKQRRQPEMTTQRFSTEQRRRPDATQRPCTGRADHRGHERREDVLQRRHQGHGAARRVAHACRAARWSP